MLGKKAIESATIIAQCNFDHAMAFRMLKEGYLDATGVQDVYFEAQQCVQAIEDLRSGKDLPELIEDPGFVIHQANLEEKKSQMWGAQLAK